ncbi:MAG: hypothetical protein KGO51_00305 [Alphaproteobacteria bacterium]|nr:hypothetical protein [Alphaproteobacteria bacterium]
MTERKSSEPSAPRAEDCRRRAAEFRAKAARARTPAVRDQMLLMAQDWDALAARQKD